MRADMAKVIVERPRHGSRQGSKGKGYQRRHQRLSWEEQPRREGMKVRSAGAHKHFNEHLGPLIRFLRSRVGQPWDKVFSEICARVNRNSAVQDHVRDHVSDIVVTDVVLRDGMPCYGGSRHGQPLRTFYRWPILYVCPTTGLLRPIKPHRPTPAPLRSHPPVKVAAGLVCVYRDRRWHLLRVLPLPDEVHRPASPEQDVWLDRRVRDLTPQAAREAYGAAVYAVSSRLVGKKELRRLPIPVEWH